MKVWLAKTYLRVLPGFATIRQQIQATVFTLHGGKRYGPTQAMSITDQRKIPEPRRLIDLNDQLSTESRFLLSFRIPGGAKAKMRRQLALYGIHDGTLFLDSDTIAEHIRKMFQ